MSHFQTLLNFAVALCFFLGLRKRTHQAIIQHFFYLSYINTSICNDTEAAFSMGSIGYR